MAIISVSRSGLSQTVEVAAQLLLNNGYDAEAVPYTLTVTEASTQGISTSLLSLLLTNGVASAPGQKGIVNTHAIDKRNGDISFELNYSLVA